MMRKDKEYIYKLRQQGRTYREIEKETGVSRATLTKWFGTLSWSKELSQENGRKNDASAKDRMERLNMVRKLKLQYGYALVESEATKEYAEFRGEPLFWAGLMLYASKGDVKSKHLIRMSSGLFHMHAVFHAFAKKYLKIKDESISCGLLLHRDLEEGRCREEWSQRLGVPADRFHKAQLMEGKQPKPPLQYGIGMSIISNTSQKKKLIKWLFLAETETFEMRS